MPHLKSPVVLPLQTANWPAALMPGAQRGLVYNRVRIPWKEIPGKNRQKKQAGENSLS